MTTFWWKWDTHLHSTGLLLPLTGRERTGHNANLHYLICHCWMGVEAHYPLNSAATKKNPVLTNYSQCLPGIVPVLLNSETQITFRSYWQPPWKESHASSAPLDRAGMTGCPLSPANTTRWEIWSFTCACCTQDRKNSFQISCGSITPRVIGTFCCCFCPERGGEKQRHIYHWFREGSAKLWCLARVLGKNRVGSVKKLPGLLLENTFLLELFTYTFLNGSSLYGTFSRYMEDNEVIQEFTRYHSSKPRVPGNLFFHLSGTLSLLIHGNRYCARHVSF